MNTLRRLQHTSAAVIACFAGLSVASVSVAGAHTQLISIAQTTPATIELLAVSSNEPIGSGNQWHSYFSSVPADTGIFAVNAKDQQANGNGELFSWFDTNGTPSSYDTGGGGIQLMTQGETSGYDTLWELTVVGKVWSATPVGPGATWPSWTALGGGAAVPGWDSVGSSGSQLSILGPNDTPWVVNGDGNCDANGNSSLYKWDVATTSWVQKSGCMYAFAEEDTCLLSVSLDSSSNSYLWTSPNSPQSWTKRAQLGIEGPGAVLTMAATGTSSSLDLYFTDTDGDLKKWSGSCSTTGSVTTLITGSGTTSIGAVSRDWAGGGATQNVYYTEYTKVGTSLVEELWQY